jgi:hypothetical protein
MPQELIIMTQAYDLVAWLLPKAERFPRIHRHTAVQWLMDAALDFQEAIYDAQSQGGSTRQRHLREADAALNKVRLYLRLGSPMAVAERRTVPPCQRHGGGDRQASGRVAEGEVRRAQGLAQRAPPFCVWPTADNAVRPGCPCAILHPAPRAANRGRRPMPEAPRYRRGRGARNRSGSRWAAGPAPLQFVTRFGTRTKPENPRCCCCCSGGCRCGRPPVCCPGCF